MSNQDIVNAIKANVKRQNNGWKFIQGKDILDKNKFLRKIDSDKTFRAFVVKLVVNLSVEILNKKGKE